jgi:hypothetical protein
VNTKRRPWQGGVAGSAEATQILPDATDTDWRDGPPWCHGDTGDCGACTIQQLAELGRRGECCAVALDLVPAGAS